MPDPSPVSPRRWLIGLPLIGLLGWLVISMWHWSTADLKIRWARQQMDSWTAVPSFDAWRGVRDVLAEARRSRPTLPDAHEQLARLYLIGAGDRQDPAAQAMLEQARASYEQALKLRPVSPYTWAGLARVTHRLGDDAAFLEAVTRADALGPWELDVQLTLIGLGHARWDRLDRAGRERTELAARRALSQKPRELRLYAKSAGMMDWLCELLDRPRQFGRQCPSAPPPAS